MSCVTLERDSNLEIFVTIMNGVGGQLDASWGSHIEAFPQGLGLTPTLTSASQAVQSVGLYLKGRRLGLPMAVAHRRGRALSGHLQSQCAFITLISVWWVSTSPEGPPSSS